MNKQEVIKAEEENRRKQEARLLVGLPSSALSMNSAPEKGLLGMQKQTQAQASKGCAYGPQFQIPSSLFQKPHLHPARRESQWWSARC